MPRRLSQRDVALLSLVMLALVLMAIQLPFGTRGFDRPQAGAHWRVLEAPGRLLGWGGVAILLLAIPYALVAWLKGRLPGRAVSALGALVFGVGVGGIAGLVATTPIQGGGLGGGALAHMLSDSLGGAVAAVVLVAIAIPGLFLSLAPLLLETGYVVRTPASGGAPATERPAPAPRTPAKGVSLLPPVLTKSPYPERRVGPDGEELPMALPGTDVGPIRYRDPPPEASAPPAPRKPIPKAEPPPPFCATPSRKAPIITGVRYKDEAPEAATPLVAPDPTLAERAAEEAALADGVRFAAPAPVRAEVVVQGPAPAHGSEPAPPPVVVYAGVEEPAPAPAAAPESAPPPTSPDAPPSASYDATSLKSSDATGAHRAAPSTPPSEPSAPGADEPPTGATPDVTNGVDPSRPHPSVAGHRRKLAESGMFDGPGPAADRPGRPPKPKPRAAPARDWREALHGLFSSLPVEELPPIRVPDDLVGTSVAEEEEARAEAPGQLRLFDAGSADADGRSGGARDALFDASVEAALERGTASLVLLKRKLGVGYARAASLIDALVEEGVLGEMTASGSRPTLLTAAEWNRRRKR